MRATLSLMATLLLLASCSKDDGPKVSAFAAPPTAVVEPTAGAAPVDPDFDPVRSIFFRECRQAYSLQSCTCTVKMMKASVDDDTYKTMKSMGMIGVIAMKGPAADKLHKVLGEAYDACAKAEDDAVSLPSSTPTPKASATKG